MLTYLRDPIWQFIGAGVAILAFAATVIVALQQRQRRELSWRVESMMPLVSSDPRVASRLRISFDGREVPSVWLLVLDLRNSGTVPILPQDFVQPLGFRLPSTWTILSASTARNPPGPNPELTVDGQRLSLYPALINQKSSVTMKVVLAASSNEGEVSVEGQVVGVRTIKGSGENPRSRMKRLPVLLVAISLTGALFLAAWVMGTVGEYEVAIAWGVTFFALSIMSPIYMLVNIVDGPFADK